MAGIRKFLFVALGMIFLMNLVLAASGLSAVGLALSSLCTGVRQLLPIASMLMIVLAGIIYAGGQMMGAETRARANVWATACLTGAIIGLLIVVVAPTILNSLYSDSTGTGMTC